MTMEEYFDDAMYNYCSLRLDAILAIQYPLKTIITAERHSYMGSLPPGP